jgi:lactoylglutathione lyase
MQGTNLPSWQLVDAHHLGLTVRDLDRSLAFYRDLLGFHLVRSRTTDADYVGRQTGFHAAYESLRRRGVRFKTPPVPVTSGPNQGGFVVYLHDPDGYTVEFFQPARVAGPLAVRDTGGGERQQMCRHPHP